MVIYNESIMSQVVPIKRSPFFYVGDKFKLIREIKEYFPKKINNFYEPFLGGGSVFLNVKANKYYLNDIDKNLISLHKTLESYSNKNKVFFKKIKKIIYDYNLSRSYVENVIPESLKVKWIKTYYAKFNKEGYSNLRNNYNSSKKRSPLDLYVLLIYGFNRMLRFNSANEFNIPVGNVDFNKNVVEALNNYFETINEREVEFSSNDYLSFLKVKYKKDDFVYIDPPYLITFSEYNKLWNELKEKELLNILDFLNKKKVKFALSNVIYYRGRENKILIDWMQKYNVYPIKSNYISYHNNSMKDIKEILITNYD